MVDPKEFAGAAKQTRLTGNLSDSGLSFIVDDASGYPTGTTAPFVVCLDLGLSSEEKILCSGRSGNTFTVAPGGRGYDSTTGQAHAATSTVDHTLDSVTLTQLVAFVVGDTFVHTSREIRLLSGTATCDGSGAFVTAHGVLLNPGQVLQAQGRYKGPSGESVSMTAVTVDATNVYGYGGTAGQLARWSFVYTDAALAW